MVPSLDFGVESVGMQGACGHTSLRGHTKQSISHVQGLWQAAQLAF